jgi:hypothetical protein
MDALSSAMAQSLGHKNSFLECPKTHPSIAGLRLMPPLPDEFKHSSCSFGRNRQGQFGRHQPHLEIGMLIKRQE